MVIADLENLEWKNSPKHMGNRLHSICSYMAMFPPSIPNYFIRKYSDPSDLVLDPFSGRGTTPLEACVLGRVGIGNDLNPLAYVLTASKVNVPSLDRILERIRELNRNYREVENSIQLTEDWKIRMLFNEYTLRQLSYLKNELNWKCDPIDTFITALVLGIMHGSSESYLSIKMPNTFSMAPNYVKNYISDHNLDKPKRDVFSLVIKKLFRCYQVVKIQGQAYNCDARNLPKILDSTIKLIVTSPPYTQVIRYGDYNWIRLWFLGSNSDDVDKNLFCSASLEKYEKFISEALQECWRVLKYDGICVLVIGDVKGRANGEVTNLAEIIWEKSASRLGFSLLTPIIEDIINENTKVSKIWGSTRGNATIIDRVLILKKY